MTTVQTGQQQTVKIRGVERRLVNPEGDAALACLDGFLELLLTENVNVETIGDTLKDLAKNPKEMRRFAHAVIRLMVTYGIEPALEKPKLGEILALFPLIGAWIEVVFEDQSFRDSLVEGMAESPQVAPSDPGRREAGRGGDAQPLDGPSVDRVPVGDKAVRPEGTGTKRR